MKKVTLNLALVFSILFNFVSPAYSASAGVPVPAPINFPNGEQTKYSIGAAVAAYMYYTTQEAIETTQEFYDTVSAIYTAMAPSAKEALANAVQAAQGGVLMYGTEALDALNQLTNAVGLTTSVQSGRTVTSLNKSAMPTAFYDWVAKEQAYQRTITGECPSYCVKFVGDSVTSRAIGEVGTLYMYVITHVDIENGVQKDAYSKVDTAYVALRDGSGRFKSDSRWMKDASQAIESVYKAVLAEYGSQAIPARPVHELSPDVSTGVRVPSISAPIGVSDTAGGLGVVIRNGRVAVPAIPRNVVHTYPDGSRDVTFEPVYPGTKPGTWVNRDGQPVSGNPVGIPVPMNPSIPWNPAKPTYKVPDGTIVTAPDGAITVPGEIAWDTPIVTTPDIPGPGPVDPTKPPDGGKPTLPPFWKPWLFVLPFLDLIRAIVQYLLRMVAFIVTLPSISPIPIPNEAFQWFRTLQVAGFQIYDTVLNFASLVLAFLLYKALRKIFNSSG